MDFEDRVEEVFLEIPEPAPEMKNANVAKTGKLLYISGQLPYSEGRLAYKGRVGMELSLDAGKTAARTAAIQTIAVLRKHLGGLNKIKRIVELRICVATGAEFKDHKKVAAASLGLIEEVFGPFGKPACTVFGCASLPEGAAVEVSLVVEVK